MIHPRYYQAGSPFAAPQVSPVPTVGATPITQTGIPQGGFAQPAINTYFSNMNPNWSPYVYQGFNRQGAAIGGPPPVVQQPVIPPQPVVETDPRRTIPTVPGGTVVTDGLPTETHPATKEYIENQVVLPAVQPTDPNYLNNPTINPNKDEWVSKTVTTPTGIQAPIITPGEPGVADPVGTHSSGPLGSFSNATVNPDGTVNIAPSGGTNDTGSIGFQDVNQVADNYTGIPNVGEAFRTDFTGVDSTGATYTQPTLTVDSSNPGNLHQATGINVGAVTPYTHVSGDPSVSSTNQLGQQETITQPGRYVKQPDGTYAFVEGETSLEYDANPPVPEASAPPTFTDKVKDTCLLYTSPSPRDS